MRISRPLFSVDVSKEKWLRGQGEGGRRGGQISRSILDPPWNICFNNDRQLHIPRELGEARLRGRELYADRLT